jgi:arabinose-5-phosphate isomerase
VSISTTDLKVKDVLLPPDQVPVMGPTTILKQALEKMNKFHLGVVCVVDEEEKLVGIFTDGDVRRLLLKSQKPFAALFVDDISVHATACFTSISAAASLSEAVAVMEEKEIWDLPVVDQDSKKFIGLLHLHPAIKAVMGL